MEILVTSGTGTVGRTTLGPLLASGAAVRVLTRDPRKLAGLPEGAEPAIGDLGDPASLAAAVRGCRRIFLVTPLHPEEARLGRNVVAAAVEAGVERIVMLGVHRADEAPGIPHFGAKVEIEAALRASDLAYTVLMPNVFFQNDLWFREALTEQGIYPQPIGELGTARVDVRDIADAAVVALTEDGHEGRRYPLVGPDRITGPDAARIWGQHLRRDVTHVGDLAAWSEQARATMPGWLVDDLVTMYDHFQHHGLRAAEEDYALQARLLPHAPRRFEDFAAQTAALWRA